MVTVPSPPPPLPPAPKDAAVKTPDAAEAKSKASETKVEEAPLKVAPVTLTAADVIKDPVAADAKKTATDAAPARKEERETKRKPPADSKQNTRSSKQSDRSPERRDRSAVSGPPPPAAPGDALHRLWERIRASRFLSISIVLHAFVVLLGGGMVLYPAIVERADFEAGSDGKLVQTDDQPGPPDLPSYSQEKVAEFAPPPPLAAPMSAMVTATQLKPAWTVKMVPPSPVRGLSDSMKGALASMENRVAQSTAAASSTGLGRAGGMRSAMIFGKQITASRLGVILDVSGSAQPHLAVAVEEIQKGFGDAVLILYPGCGMMKTEGKSEHVIRNLASIPPEELPNNAGYFTTAAQIVDVMKIPEFEQMARRSSVKNTLFVSWYAPPEGGTPDKMTNQAQAAFEDLMKRGVDAIYWFADFEDPIDPRVADPLIAQLTFKRIKVHLHNFAGRKINSEATNIAEKTGGTINTDKPKK